MLYSEKKIANFKNTKFDFLLIDEKDNVLTVRLNRPEKKNAIHPLMLRELAFAFSYAHHNHDTRVVVLAANGDVFCAGADMGELLNQPSTIPEPESEILLGELFVKLHKPIIVKVHAPVYAGGIMFVAGCNFAIASDNATFAFPEVKRGIWPMQVMECLLNVMPPRKALELCILGKTLTSAEALHAGLITTSVPANILDDEVNKLTSVICSNSPAAIKCGLRTYDEMRTVPKENRHLYLKKMLNELLLCDDAKEGISAFREKRKPVWE